mgnify:CR=1 FL=1
MKIKEKRLTKIRETKGTLEKREKQPASGEVRISISGRGWTIPDDVGQVLSGFDFSSKTLGVGFGLLMTREFLKAHEGTIHWKRTDASASFEVRLPMTRRDP